MSASDAMTPADQFRSMEPTFQRLRGEVVFILKAGTKARDIKIHSITGRVKELDSFLDKVRRKGYADPFGEIQDFVGCRVVCLFLADLPRLREMIDQMFVIVEEENKVESSEIGTFGYMSVHYICKLRSDHIGPRYEGLQDVLFEVQTRTILMDAWANVSHYLDYKGETSIPGDLKRDFHALSGLFFVADRHFELFYGESVGSASRAVEASMTAAAFEKGQEDATELPLDLETVAAYLSNKYPDREVTSRPAISEFVEEVAPFGYRTLGELDRDLTRAHAAAIRYEMDYPPAAGDRKFAGVGLARQALAIANESYADSKYSRDRHADYREFLEDYCEP